MAKPLSSLMQILSRPHNKELALRSSGLAQSARPFVGFFLFCIGKLLITLSLLYLSDMIAPGHFTKPLTVYNQIGGLMLSPLGLHSYLAYQEFHFYSFCSYYRSFANRVLETSEKEQTTLKPIATAAGKEKNILVYDRPREALLHSNLKELIDTMKNMTETFGPFLLQNFSLMLLYWLLHSYYLCYFVIQTVGTLSLANPTLMALNCLMFVGSVLIIRWWYQMISEVMVLLLFSQLGALEGGDSLLCMWTIHWDSWTGFPLMFITHTQ